MEKEEEIIREIKMTNNFLNLIKEKLDKLIKLMEEKWQV
jgi:hypothetical protein